MQLVVLGLSITSSWGNGHATTYRALLREFAQRGHSVTFLERDVPWYSGQRDLTSFPWADVFLYTGLHDLAARFTQLVRAADAVIVGSYVPDGIAVGDWVLATATGTTAFYDIDTPLTLAQLATGGTDYLATRQIPHYPLYLSFAGGRSLEVLRRQFGSPNPQPLYCSVDPQLYHPEIRNEPRWLLGYLGTFSHDRQPALDALLLEPARQLPGASFIVAGPQYPAHIKWPTNVARTEHLAPAEHRNFYTSQLFTLNVTRADMRAAGHAPSVRLFEAAACATPIISDAWDGIDEFFTNGEEILIAHTSEEVVELLRHTSATRAAAIGAAARRRILAAHTAAHRAAQLENYLLEVAAPQPAGQLAI